mgnify:CR=1 FL=1
MFIDDLHFQVDRGIQVQIYPDIQKKGFAVSGFTKHDRIRDLHRSDFRWRKVKQRGNEVSKYLVVLLQESSEQVIVCHRDGEFAMLRELNVVLSVRHENKILLRMV